MPWVLWKLGRELQLQGLVRDLALADDVGGTSEEQILDLLRRTQELEKQKVMLTGVVLIVMGVAFQSLSHTLGGSGVKDFFSGLLLGLSVAEMLAGIAVICKGAKRK